MLLNVIFFTVLVTPGSECQSVTDTLIKSVSSTHAMEYYVSLPKGWNRNRKWPVLVVLEAAGKEFKLNAERFVAARKELPFIIVAPVTVTNGNYGKRDSTIYPYSAATWDMIDREGICQFDMKGLSAVMENERRNHNAEEKFYVTGFEAGAHLLWAMVFQHPEQLQAAIAVAGNYRNRCMEDKIRSTKKSTFDLPILGLYGETDSLFGKHGPMYLQWLEAKRQASQNGYRNCREREIKGKGHIPLPAEIFKNLALLLKKGRRSSSIVVKE
jgi:predicted esterase